MAQDTVIFNFCINERVRFRVGLDLVEGRVYALIKNRNGALRYQVEWRTGPQNYPIIQELAATELTLVP
jgi:hypothetical protein